MSDQPLLRVTERSMLLATASVLRQIYERGYVDWHVEGEPDLLGLADQFDSFVKTYSGAFEADPFKVV